MKTTIFANTVHNTRYMKKFKAVQLYSLNMIIDHILNKNITRMPEQKRLNFENFNKDNIKQFVIKNYCESTDDSNIPLYFSDEQCKKNSHIDNDFNKPLTSDYKTFFQNYCSLNDNYLQDTCFNLCKATTNNEMQNICDNIYDNKCEEVVQTAITTIAATDTEPEKKFYFYSNLEYSKKDQLNIAQRRCACYYTVDKIPEYSDITSGDLLDQTLNTRIGCLSNFCANDPEAYQNRYKRNEQCDLCISNTKIESSEYGSINASDIKQVQSCNTATEEVKPEPPTEPSTELSEEELQQQIDNIDTELNEFNSTLTALIDEKDKLDDDLEQKEDEKDKLELELQNEMDIEKKEEIQNKLDEINGQIVQLTTDIEDKNSSIENITKQIDDKNDEKDTLNSKKEDISSTSTTEEKSVEIETKTIFDDIDNEFTWIGFIIGIILSLISIINLLTGGSTLNILLLLIGVSLISLPFIS